MKTIKAFTLTELLVVLAVIGVLAALLLPTLSRAKSRANRTACANNLRQINAGLLMYAHESADMLPLLPRPNPYPSGEAYFFKELMKGYVGLSGPPRKGDRLFFCPSESRSPTEGLPSTALVEDYSDYYFNAWMTGQKLARVVHPIRTLLVTEFPAEVGYSWHQPQAKYVLVNNPPNVAPFLHAAYNDALNEVSFVDGHVDYLKIYNDAMSMSGLYNPPASYQYQWSPD